MSDTIRTAEEMREACIAVAQSFKVDGCSAIQFHTADRIQVTTRALPVAPREVPAEVREWVRIHIGALPGDSLHARLERFTLDWIRKEFGI